MFCLCITLASRARLRQMIATRWHDTCWPGFTDSGLGVWLRRGKNISTVHCCQISCEGARANRTGERVELKSADIRLKLSSSTGQVISITREMFNRVRYSN